MKFGILVFPGSNCDADCLYVAQNIMGQQALSIWHKETSLPDVDAIIIPGGFSFGDYLRCGAIAKFSPVMKAVSSFANDGGLVLGICNGFQILIEAGLLPGALIRNKNLKFICDEVHLKLRNNKTKFTHQGNVDQVYKIPIAHMEGNYFIDDEGLKELQDNNQIIFQYCNEQGEVGMHANPNGSVSNIAGLINKKGNVLGMMPHPERVSEKLLGRLDGKFIFESICKK